MDKLPQVTKRPVKRLSTRQALQAGHDRRSQFRLARREHLFVQLSATLTGEQTRRTLKCRSADLSRGGLRLALSEALPPGALLEIWIRLANMRRNYYLVGDVRWCAASRRGYQVGVRVKNGPATDYRIWRRLCFE